MWRMVWLWLWSAAVFAGVPDAPVLRLETGMHTAKINRIGTDAAQRFVVTASGDKTARVWDLASGQLLQVLRPPLGAGNEGKLYAVALSPDGQEVAVGGWTGHEWDKKISLYLFDRASGRLTGRISGLPNVVLHLGYSPDGQFLAAALGGANGIRLYRRSDGAEVARDGDYGNSCYRLDFDRQGRLVSSSEDGHVRLYDSQLKLLVKVKTMGGLQPSGVRFSPDGQRIALGFDDNAALHVLSGQTLGLLYAVNQQISNGNLTAVAWSADGHTLYAAGRYNNEGVRPLRRWEQAGQGAVQDVPLSSDTLMDLLPLTDGRVLYGSAAPAWGVVGRDGRKLLEKVMDIVDFRETGLDVDATATRFRFHPYQQAEKSRVFDLTHTQWLPSVSTMQPPLSPAKTSSRQFNIEYWHNNSYTLFNTQPVGLQANEISRSLAIAADEQHFVLGTEWSLRYFDQQGKPLWRQPVPGEVWAVNLSADNRLVVAAFGDGTIRWYRTSDGAEQLAFFPHADGQRWVAWTPTGYYDASAGGESLMGWHVNQGAEQAGDFFPASRFRERFYRPDVVRQILQTLDEAEAVRIANAAAGRRTQTTVIAQVLPPVVELRSAAELRTDAASITLRYQIRPNGEAERGLGRVSSSAEGAEITLGVRTDAPLTGMRVRVNGQAVSAERGLSRVKTDEAQTLTFAVPGQDSEVQIFAENEHGVSVPLTVQIKRTAKPAAASGGFNIKPKLYVLAVGVAQYQHPDINPLGLSAKDARDFAAAMQRQKSLYREVEVKLLTDAEATRDNVVDGLEWLQKQVTQHDVGMLFVAGHGVNDATAGYYFLPANADPNKLKRTGVSMADIRGTMSNLAGKAVFFVDTCHAGNVLGGGRRSALASDMTGVINELASAENGVVVFSSSTGRQFSLENPAWGNGAFTKAVVEGINGGADYQKTGRITHKMLDLFVSERVKQLTDGQQSPVTQAPGGVPDFPIAAP